MNIHSTQDETTVYTAFQLSVVGIEAERSPVLARVMASTES